MSVNHILLAEHVVNVRRIFSNVLIVQRDTGNFGKNKINNLISPTKIDIGKELSVFSTHVVHVARHVVVSHFAFRFIATLSQLVGRKII